MRSKSARGARPQAVEAYIVRMDAPGAKKRIHRAPDLPVGRKFVFLRKENFLRKEKKLRSLVVTCTCTPPR